jgi:hypothetical protein
MCRRLPIILCCVYSFQLFSLNNVTEGDLKLLATDGRSIKARLKSLVERTAEDIMSCSNVCDAYAKKRLLAKVFQGPAWNVKLLDWATLFSKRRKDFMVELTIHTNRGVDEANAKLEALDKKLEAFDKKFEYLRISSGHMLSCVTG